MSFSKEPLLFELSMYEEPAPKAKQFLIPTGEWEKSNIDAYNKRCEAWMEEATKDEPHPEDIRVTTMHYQREGYEGRALVYRPDTDEKLPIIFYTHGGSFLFWTPEYSDVMCRNIAHEGHCVVVNMDFRQNFRGFYAKDMYEDVYAGLQAVYDQADSFGGDTERMATMGDSSGGQIAGGLPIMARDRGYAGKIGLRILLAGGVGFDVNEISNNNANASKTMLMGAENVVKRLFEKFEECEHPYWSPYLDPHPELMPPTAFIVGTADYMWHDVSIYANKLRNAGVPINVRLYSGMMHGFYNGGCGPQCLDCWQHIGRMVKEYLA